jgi:heme-degrading monooxygenase HmoA
MAYMVTGRYRVRAGQETKFVAQMELLEDLLRREGRGLRYWALARSTGEPGVFNSVAIWESPDDERRMADHPLRQALLPVVQRLLAEQPTGVGGTIALEIAGRRAG